MSHQRSKEQLDWAFRRWRRGDTEGALRQLDSVLDSDLDLSELDLRPAVGVGADPPDGEWWWIVWHHLQICHRPLEAERWRRLARESGCTLPAPAQRPVLRLVHHLACSGGTLISKCLAALPRVALLSELNPRSRSAPAFLPAAPLLLLEKAHRPLTPEEIAAGFRAEFAQVLEIARADDLDLVLRDHSHSDFCVATEPSNAPMLRGLLEVRHPLLSVLTLRHPLDCWLGLVHAGWQGQMQPASLREYCRRHQAFLDAYPGVPWFHYEDFVLHPQAGLEELCDRLCLDCDHGALERIAGISMSGASGRGGDRIEPRLRRPLPESVQLELEDPATAQALGELCERLHYQLEDPFA
ncbi:MAG: sulfotransferase [Cyanobium sp.]